MVEDLIKRLRLFHETRAPIPSVPSIATEAADLIEQQVARLTALESERDALLAAAGKEAVPAGYLYTFATSSRPHDPIKRFSTYRFQKPESLDETVISCVPLYTDPTAALEKGDGRDAERYRHLRQCNSGSLVIVQIIGTGEDDQIVLTEEHADEAIDDALSQQKEVRDET